MTSFKNWVPPVGLPPTAWPWRRRGKCAVQLEGKSKGLVNRSGVLGGRERNEAKRRVDECRSRRGRVMRGVPRGRQESSPDGGQVEWVRSRHEGTTSGGKCLRDRLDEAAHWHFGLVALMHAWSAPDGSSVVIGFVLLAGLCGFLATLAPLAAPSPRAREPSCTQSSLLSLADQPGRSARKRLAPVSDQHHVFLGCILLDESRCPWKRQLSDLGRLQNHLILFLRRGVDLGDTVTLFGYGQILHRETRGELGRLVLLSEEFTSLSPSSS